jgi:polyisoprenoid-binding protein YceI
MTKRRVSELGMPKPPGSGAEPATILSSPAWRQLPCRGVKCLAPLDRLGRTQFSGSARKTLFVLALALFAVSRASVAIAQEEVLELDPAQTQVRFSLGDVLHTVRGRFNVEHGTIDFDPSTGRASGLVVVDAASGESGNRARDHKMHKDILESARYPQITFAPNQVQGPVVPQQEFKLQVLGTLALHGASRPLTLIVLARLAGRQLTADTQFRIPYVSWGLKNPSTFLLRVNDTVDIAVHAVGRLTTRKANDQKS